MSSDNPSGADNQQETSRTESIRNPWWVVGFVDGEGCFSVSVHRAKHLRSNGGWQVQPAFQVYQHKDNLHILEALVRYFGCGYVRPKGPRSSVCTYSVWSLRQLESQILPFFDAYPPSVKDRDYRAFAKVVGMMRRGDHRTPAGFKQVVRLAFSMNANGKQRTRTIDEILVGSSETVR